MPRSIALACLCSLLGVLPSGTAEAAEEEDRKIEKLVREAQKAYDAGDCKKSAETLQKAFELKAVSKLLFNIARSFEKCGEDEQAIRFYERYVDAGEDTGLVRRASKALERLKQARAARLAEEKRQQEEARKVEEARRDAELAKVATEKAQAEARASEAEERSRRALAEERRAISRGPSPFTFGLAGLAVVGLGTGIAFGAMANGAKGDYSASTNLAAKQSLRSTAEQRALVADLSLGIAAASAVGATVLFFLTTSGAEPAPVTFSAGPGGVALSGSWP
ncbi:MAG: hypothetical protein HY901_19370 [Deltaproteobacteria bacterium]|nr:hypothetical protein [Deltaproteobacteria bacterium]